MFPQLDFFRGKVFTLDCRSCEENTMGSCDTRGMHKRILIPSMALAFLETPLLAFLPGFTGVFVFFYIAAVALLTVHWWALAAAIESLFNDEKTLAALRVLLALFPAFLTLALIYVAAKLNRAFLVPSAAGVASVTVMVALFCAIRGIAGLLIPTRKRIEV
jgi:hypothetical protein